MIEACFCGRVGELLDRTPVVDGRGPGLQCPSCGDVDHLVVFSEQARVELWTEAKERELRTVPPRRRGAASTADGPLHRGTRPPVGPGNASSGGSPVRPGPRSR